MHLILGKLENPLQSNKYLNRVILFSRGVEGCNQIKDLLGKILCFLF